jgi:hypothetical protein
MDQGGTPWGLVYSLGVLGEMMRRGLEREMQRIDWSQVKD